MPQCTAEELRKLGRRLLEAAGVPGPTAALVSDSLVESNLMGHDSHGIIRLLEYLDSIAAGRISPRAEVEVVKETPTTALLDAHWAFGQVAAARAMAIAIEKARVHHVAVVGMAHSSHIGRLGEYALMAAEQGLIGAVMCNASPNGGAAPYGGMARMLGTNPLAYAIPTGGPWPFLMDFATTTCAEGKVRVARAKGVPLPPGCILDKEGRPSTNPDDFYAGGVLLPMGGHKGYGLSLLMDLLGGALTGHGCTCLPEYVAGNGVLMMAIDIEAFSPLAQFEDTAGRLFAAIKASRPAPGVEEILIPGEPEFRTKERRLREGIPVPERTWCDLQRAAQRLGLQWGA
jgi:LDH2 family malate/lactate/ureidoglycolate dehydrogenase